ncbi:PPM1K-like protein [Mya arenaria]|uniref:PPM1K-like protein n=1 Tax=Mya arenaria TaxID=6604 RepID=A0ABY7DTH1_MYAAR|nr:protein phosphatase 1K, mitochondrial-like [Mya arenaria]WAR00179.1 PPM1K-like protein [Mya arenaria]
MFGVVQCPKTGAVVHLTKQLLSHANNRSRCLTRALTETPTGQKQTTRQIHTGKASRLAGHLSDPENRGERQRGVNFDTLGAWNNRIELPVSIEKSIERGQLIPDLPIDNVGSASLQGRRQENEDRFIVKKLRENLLCFAIFDGHGGSAAVNFVHENIEHHIRYWLGRTEKLADVLRKSFIDVNNLLSRHLAFQGADVMTGTTATVCLLQNSIELVIGHVGDTRAILCREGEAIRLSKDHTPENVGEIERIIKAGGSISENSLGVANVNGRLSMTRSIGDFELKHYGVIADPYICSVTLKHDKDSFLLLESDGLSFVLNDQELVDIVTCCSTPLEAAEFVTDQALQFGSEDNVTAVVIPFGAWGKYRNTSARIPYSFGRHLTSHRY